MQCLCATGIVLQRECSAFLVGHRQTIDMQLHVFERVRVKEGKSGGLMCFPSSGRLLREIADKVVKTGQKSCS